MRSFCSTTTTARPVASCVAAMHTASTWPDSRLRRIPGHGIEHPAPAARAARCRAARRAGPGRRPSRSCCATLRTPKSLRGIEIRSRGPKRKISSTWRSSQIFDQPWTAAVLLVGGGGHEGSVDGAHRGAADDLEARLHTLAPWQVVEDELQRRLPRRRRARHRPRGRRRASGDHSERCWPLDGRYLETRSAYSPVRVSTRIVSPSSMKSGTFSVAPDSIVAGLLAPEAGVALHARDRT